MRIARAFSIGVTAALLAGGCGSGGGGGEAAPPSVPVVTHHTQTLDGTAWDFEFFWNASTPGGGPGEVQYEAELYTATGGIPTFPFDFENDGELYASSGRISSLSWALQDVPGGALYVLRVRARQGHDLASGWGVYEQNNVGSCPFLFVWDGAKHAFESDMIPNGRLATRGGSGYIRPYPTDAYVMATTPAPKGDAYELRLTGESDEVEYVDEVRLVALYHPDSTALVSECPPLGVAARPGLEGIHTVRTALTPPRSAVHVNTGADVTAAVTATDADVVTLNEDANVGFGYQTLELDLGDLRGAPQIKLVVDGQTAFPTTPEGSARAGRFGPRTRIEVPTADGGWTEVPHEVAQLTSLAAFRRVIVLDLTRAFPTETFRVRLTWLLKTVVNAILLDTSPDEPIRAVPLTLRSADLRLRGYSGRTSGELFEFVYDEIGFRQPRYFAGAYTRYGDVRELLTAADDRFAIFFGGDELSLRFELAAPPGPGERLGFAFLTNGYYKDRKTDLPATVEPLPFATMSNYPYGPGEAYPSDPLHDDYRALWNTRVK